MFTVSDFDHQTHISIMTASVAGGLNHHHQRQQQQQPSQQQSRNQDDDNDASVSSTGVTTSKPTTIKRTTKLNSNYSRPGRTKQAALLELFYGSTLYAICIVLPHLPRYIYKTCMWANLWMNVIRERILWSIFILWRISLIVLEKYGWDNPFQLNYYNNAVLNSVVDEDHQLHNRPSILARGRRRIRKYIFSTSTASLWEEFNQRQENQPLAGTHTWGFGKTQSAFPAILMVLQDIQFLFCLAVTLAIIRIYFVHMLVPEYLAPKRLEELTRVKSSHLLSSSSYSFGRGWARERNGVSSESLSGRCSSINNTMREGGKENKKGRGGLYERLLTWTSYHWYRLNPTIRRALGHEPSNRYNDAFMNQPPNSPTTTPTTFHRSNSATHPSMQHLFSAPRFATATFRLLYTSLSCLSALLLFQSAEFWPRYVFGKHEQASTQHCWDLSGSFSALGFLDADYDNRKGALKYFFLAQAAYQLHSLCFHFVSMLLLLHIRFQQRRQQQLMQSRPISMKTSMQSYFRPMIEHVIVLILLTGAYLFSGLRRLGAVMIFTLELSSAFLQLLQVCIYAPESSWLRKPEVVGFVHRCLTVPMFLYCRFFVLPFVIWYSAAFESFEWLEQIEKVFSPGWSERIYVVFNGLLFLIFTLNLVLFRRLLFHPHLQKIYRESHKR